MSASASPTDDLIFGVVLLSPLWIGAIAMFVTWAVVDCGLPWTDVARAKSRRRARWRAYFVEFLNYGYAENVAREKADVKMAAEAKAADEIKP